MHSLLDYIGYYGGQMLVDKLERNREEKNNQTTVEQLINAAQNELAEEQMRQGLTPFTGQGQGGEMLGWTQPEAGPEALATQRGTSATPQGRGFGLRDYLDILENRKVSATQRLQSLGTLYKLSKFVTPGQKIAGKYERYNRDTGRNEIVTYNESGQETVAGESKHGEPRPLTEEELIQESTEVDPETGEPTVGAKNAKKILNESENRELNIYGEKKKLEEKYRTPPEPKVYSSENWTLPDNTIVRSEDQGRTYLGRDGKRYKMPFGAIKGLPKLSKIITYGYGGKKYSFPEEQYNKLLEDRKVILQKIAGDTNLTSQQKLEEQMKIVTDNLSLYGGREVGQTDSNDPLGWRK